MNKVANYYYARFAHHNGNTKVIGAHKYPV